MWFIDRYSSGLRHMHWGNHKRAREVILFDMGEIDQN